MSSHIDVTCLPGGSLPPSIRPIAPAISTLRSSGGIRPQPGTTTGEDPLTVRTRATWTAGDFGEIARGFSRGAAEFIARLGLRPGERVLDVACGTGNLALPAAAAGAEVTGLDIAPNLIATARAQAAALGLAVRFDEGDAEALPYAGASFETTVSMFGAMFAPRPAKVVHELLRVTKPGGRIVMANWTPDGFIGRMLKAHVARVAPPEGVPSVLLWGDQRTVTERFGQNARPLMLARRTITFTYPFSPAGVVELFRTCYGPTVRTFAAIDPDQRVALQAELTALWTEQNVATDGTTRVEAEYLEVVVGMPAM